MYKKGRENLAADALSRRPKEEEEGVQSEQLMSILYQPMPDWLNQLREENGSDDWVINLHKLILKQTATEGYSIWDGFLMYHHRYYLGPKSAMRALILQEFHGFKLGGHANYYRTLHRVRQ